MISQISLNVFTDQDVYNQKFSSFPKADNINFFFELDEKIIQKSDCIMTDVYNSMNDNEKLDTYNKEIKLKKFQVNENLMNLSNDKCVFMHCLPANKGIEVTEGVINSPKSILLKQAKNRLIAQKGILKWLDI